MLKVGLGTETNISDVTLCKEKSETGPVTRRDGSVGRVLAFGSRDTGSTFIFRNNLGQVVNLHLLRSTKPFIPTGSMN